jgi:hypothetical protein
LNLSTPCILAAGQDATDAFYGLHRHEVLTRPQFARLQVGTIEGESSILYSKISGELSKVPYAEPTWLSDGFYSPYYKEVLTESLFAQRMSQYSMF